MVAMQDIEKAYVRPLNNEVEYRHMATLKPAAKVSRAARGAYALAGGNWDMTSTRTSASTYPDQA
jgi:hypothetical protein